MVCFGRYETSEFLIACVLKAYGYPFDGTEYDQLGELMFVFDDRYGDVDKTLLKYLDRKLEIDAWTFVEGVNELKIRLDQRGMR